MDDTLKRRLVGGLLLIGLAWLLAALLPAPPPPGERSEQTTVFDLRNPDAPARTTVDAAAVQPSAVPTPPAAAPDATDDAAGDWPMADVPDPAPAVAQPKPPVVARTPPVATPAPRPTPAPTVAPSAAPSGGWWVQVGAYSAREGAEQVRETLRVADLPARVLSAAVNGKTIHRVRVGPYSSETQAESAQARAVLLGHANATVIRP